LTDPPISAARAGVYHLISKDRANIPGEFLYRLSHPLGEYVTQTGKSFPAPVAQVKFDISNHPAIISVVEELKGQSGWLVLQRLIIDSFEREEYLLFSAVDDGGRALDHETCEKLFNCCGKTGQEVNLSPDVEQRLTAESDRYTNATINKSLERNNRHFNEAREQLEKWADDMILATEKELRDTKEQIKVLNRQARQAATIQEQHDFQEKICEMETKKRRLRQRIFDVEDEIAEKRDKLIDALEKRMQQRTSAKPLFTIQWQVV
jgi:hypothetical protein